MAKETLSNASSKKAKTKSGPAKAARNKVNSKRASSKPIPTKKQGKSKSTVTKVDNTSQSLQGNGVNNSMPIVGIGASAGGLEALQSFFKEMSPNTGAAFVVIVHLSPDFKSLMPELIAKHTQMPVIAPEHGTIIQPNSVYIIPPGKNMTLKQQTIHLHAQDRSPGHSLNLPIDLFFSSLSEEAREQGVAIILSGTGSDGSRGIRKVKEVGGMVLVQKPDSAKFEGMPMVAVETRLADVVAPPKELAIALFKYFKNVDTPLFEPSENLNTELHHLLKKASGLDLSYYRSAVVERRVRRRMGLSGFVQPNDYAKFLSKNSSEAQQLVKDLLIGVTSFFRDAYVFEYLENEVLPKILEDKPKGEELRVWVPACSTGEEVYSLAILILELKQTLKHEDSFTIFATDIDHESVAKASLGEYPLSLLADLSPLRLGKYFTQQGGNYLVNPEIRKHIRFAQHDLLQDTPFSKIDLVSCRNFLIYVKPSKQERVISALHFSLKSNGQMLLGPAETVVGFDGALEAVSLRHKLYRKIGAVAKRLAHWSTLPGDPITKEASRRLPIDDRTSRQEDKVGQILSTLLNMNQQTVVLITMEGDLLEVFEDRHALFRIPKGKLTNNLSKLIVPELHAPLLAGLHRLKKGASDVLYQIEYNSQHLQFHMSILPENAGQALLVVREDQRHDPRQAVPTRASQSWDPKASDVIYGLETELQHTKENLQAMIEELQTTNEEQQSTNEELVASNEELQSTNEELQSVNEELYTVNQEFNNKNQELSVLAQDLENLIRATNIGTLYLDQALTIRKFTPAVTEIIPILNSDIGRPLKDLVHGLNYDVLVDIESVRETRQHLEREVRDTKGAWILMRCHPYLTEGSLEGGVLVTFVNVTTLKNAQEFSILVNQKLEEANRTLTEQSEELEDLFSILAHDLKRPVISLDGLLTIVEQSVNWPTEDKSRSHLLKALEECRRMQRLLSDVTQVSGKARQQPVYENVDLQSFLDTIIERFFQQTRSLGVRLNVSCDPGNILLPKAILEQSAQNLIENAIKYGTSNAKPRIDVSCHLQGNQLFFSVIDNGKGISASNHAKVFELFRRLDPNAVEGSGIGLVAVRRQIAKVGGEVHLESSEGMGAKFSFTIPIRQSLSPVSSGSYNVLLIEDDALDKKIVQRCLDEIEVQFSNSIELIWAQTLSEAKDMLRSQPINLILLDLSLPDGHGLNLLTELHSTSDSPLPVVILSGQAEGIPFKQLEGQQVSYLSKAELTATSLHSIIQGLVVESEKA